MKYKNDSIKALIEKRNAKITELETITNNALEEKRAFSGEETEKVKKLEEEIRALGDTINVCKKDYDKEIDDNPNQEQRAEKDVTESEERAFLNYIKNKPIDEELRADSNWQTAENGAVIPTSIANRILEEVKDRCNIYNYASSYNVGGKLTFPVYDEEDGGITMCYAEEFAEVSATKGKFKSIELSGYLASAITKVPKSLINNSQFDLLPYIISKVAEAVANFIEGELLKGTTDKIKGMSDVEVVATTLTADSIIDLQDSVKSRFQGNAKFIMNGKTKNKIRKLKDGQGNYLLVRDYANNTGSGWNLLGKPVEISDQMNDDDIFYGDYSGIGLKISEAPNIQVLWEKYAEQHVVGLVAWLEMDAKVLEPQKIKRLKVGGTTGGETTTGGENG